MADLGYDVYAAAREEYRKKIAEQAAEIERLRAALELYRDAVRIDATMEGPKFMGANSSALKRAWDADLAALEAWTGKTEYAGFDADNTMRHTITLPTEVK